MHIEEELQYPGARYRITGAECSCGQPGCSFDALVTFRVPDEWDIAITRIECASPPPTLGARVIAAVEEYITLTEIPRDAVGRSRFVWEPGDLQVVKEGG